MKTITDDIEGFFDNGGWSFLDPESDEENAAHVCIPFVSNRDTVRYVNHVEDIIFFYFWDALPKPGTER